MFSSSQSWVFSLESPTSSSTEPCCPRHTERWQSLDNLIPDRSISVDYTGEYRAGSGECWRPRSHQAPVQWTHSDPGHHIKSVSRLKKAPGAHIRPTQGTRHTARGTRHTEHGTPLTEFLELVRNSYRSQWPDPAFINILVSGNYSLFTAMQWTEGIGLHFIVNNQSKLFRNFISVVFRSGKWFTFIYSIINYW